MDFAINKKVFVEVGVRNLTNEYPDYPILWFPQGVFYISSCQVAATAANAVTISLSLKDKMAGLNGEVGGTIPATTIFDEMDTQATSGEYVTEKVLIYNIIQEAVNHYGEEDLNNIIIEDVDEQIREVVKWTGDTPLYLISQGSGSGLSSSPTLIASVDEPSASDQVYGTYYNGDDVGYIYTDFVMPGELTVSPGATVTTVLDEIVSTLGNYEYFYDEYGIFHFQEIKNYVNTTQAKTVVTSMTKNDYLVETTVGKSTHTFKDDVNMTSFNCNPQYTNIKNDYVVQGLRQMTSSDISYPVRYHLAIDSKPTVSGTTTVTTTSSTGEITSKTYEYYSVSEKFLTYDDPDSQARTGCFPLFNEGAEEWPPEVGNFNVVYAVDESYLSKSMEEDIAAKKESVNSNDDMTAAEKANKIAALDEELANYIASMDVSDGKCFLYWAGAGYMPVENPIYYEKYYTKDWRTELYVQGLKAVNLGTDANYYYAELASGWTEIYDIDNQEFYAESQGGAALTDGNYYLDFIDPSTSALGEFSGANIGRRSDVVEDDDVNCLFAPEIPNVVFVNQDDDGWEDQFDYLQSIGEVPSKVRNDVYSGFAEGGYKNGAFDQIKYELYLHTSYQRTVTITGIPAFYLEPNTRCTVNDRTTNTFGDYIIQTVTIPFGSGSIMSVTASEVTERL
jgi:hypothetical protein